MAGELGRLAEEQHQQARGEGIERAGVPRLFHAVQLLGLLQGAIGADAYGLVEQQRRIDHFLVDSMSRESRSPRSTDSSYSKRSSGVVKSLMRFASCER